MAFAKVYSAQPVFLSAQLVTVETDLSRGLHSFTIVGLPDKAVEESRDRVSAAIKNSGFTSPKSKNQKVVISLAPADVRKEGPLFDLAMALSYLRASDDIAFDPDGKLFLGELALNGEVRPVRGVLAIARKAKEMGIQELYVPNDNVSEAALVEDISVFGVSSLKDVVDHVNTRSATTQLIEAEQSLIAPSRPPYAVSFDDIRGQETAKRGLAIAAAGRHNIVLFGPPGTGKTMLARAFATILPPLSFEEALEVTTIHSVAGVLSDNLVTYPPFRTPHHSASHVSLVGGGTIPKPGEVSLAHRGVLFLDEFPEFERRSIDSLRQPLEDRIVTISRARGVATFPASFVLVAAMNPSPGSQTEHITAHEQQRYWKKISGPIIDRIDMWIEVPHIDHEKLAERTKRTKETEAITNLVASARKVQRDRFKDAGIYTNAEMSVRQLEDVIHLDSETQQVLTDAAKRLDLSPRSYHRVIKLARTIADIDESEQIKTPHILEALTYRPKLPEF